MLVKLRDHLTRAGGQADDPGTFALRRYGVIQQITDQLPVLQRQLLRHALGEERALADQ